MRIIIVISLIFSLTGCVVVPRRKESIPLGAYGPLSFTTVEKIVGPKRYLSRWRSITLHHSATFEGNAECFDRNHRSRMMGGLFYHFVIGNGSGSGDGEIEVGWRWKEQQEANRPSDIQICLVGNFNKELVSAAQFDALIKLIKVLRRQYNIPLVDIRKHQDVAEKFTECPGENFPFYRLSAELKKSN